MNKSKVLYVNNSKASAKTLEEFNRLTALNWISLPESLLPNGLVLNANEMTAKRLIK